MVSSHYFHKSTFLFSALLLLYAAQFQSGRASSVPCKNESCENDPLSSKRSKKNVYDATEGICMCSSYNDECVYMSENGILARCSSSPSGLSKKSCFCATRTNKFGRDGCGMNTAEVATSFDYKNYCVSCTFLPPRNASLRQSKCSTTYNFQAPPIHNNGSYFHSCNITYKCSKEFYCQLATTKSYFTICDNDRLNNNATSSCFCAPVDFTPCTVFSPCPSGYSCVRPANVATQICAPSESLVRVNPPMKPVPTLPKTTLLILASTELIFVMFKCVAFMRSEKHWHIFAFVCFIVETIIGFSLTAMQVFITIHSRVKNISYSFEVRLFVGATLFVFTELCAVISEAVSVRRKIKPPEDDITKYKHKYRFSLVRRVVTKWIALSTTLFSMGFSNMYNFQFELRSLNIIFISITILVSCYGVFTLFHYRRYWTRILISTGIILTSIILTAVFVLIRKNHVNFVVPDKYYYFSVCGSLLSAEPIIMFCFGFNIFLTALSAFRLLDHSAMNNITEEQVEFFETAVLGTALPCIWIALVSCVEETILVFVVAGPQVGVLLVPLLFDYIKVLHSKLKFKQTIHAENDICSDL